MRKLILIAGKKATGTVYAFYNGIYVITKQNSILRQDYLHTTGLLCFHITALHSTGHYYSIGLCHAHCYFIKPAG